jgi:SAM-dependent methyltransferase
MASREADRARPAPGPGPYAPPDRRTGRDRTPGPDRASGPGPATGPGGTPGPDPAAGPGLRARRASSFGSQAAAYAEHRPDYPRQGLLWALEPALAAAGERADRDRAGGGRDSGHGGGERAGGGRFDGTLDVLDLGAGTGRLTGGLLALGHRVTAVEPDPAMLAELRARLPAATALAGGAEDVPLPDASVDAVLVGQALHWFDQERALPSVARVLRPGGVLAALWNTDDDREPWVAALHRIVRMPRSTGWPADGEGIAGHPAFGPVEHARFSHRQPRTAASLTATVATHSGVALMAPQERARLLERVRGLLETRPETATGTFELPLVTFVQRCVRAVR